MPVTFILAVAVIGAHMLFEKRAMASSALWSKAGVSALFMVCLLVQPRETAQYVWPLGPGLALWLLGSAIFTS